MYSTRRFNGHAHAQAAPPRSALSIEGEVRGTAAVDEDGGAAKAQLQEDLEEQDGQELEDDEQQDEEPAPGDAAAAGESPFW